MGHPPCQGEQRGQAGLGREESLQKGEGWKTMQKSSQLPWDHSPHLVWLPGSLLVAFTRGGQILPPTYPVLLASECLSRTPWHP